MAVTKLMKEASERMEAAARRLQQSREAPFTPGNLREWMVALTDYALALGEVQEYSQQSIHEKLQALAREAGHPLAAPRSRSARGA